MKARTKAPLPSMTLPPLALLDTKTKQQITSILASLAEIYCPLSTAFHSTLAAAHPHHPHHQDTLAPPAFDSGYASETNEGEDEDDKGADLRDVTDIREDAFERTCVTRWITGFIDRAGELGCLADEEEREWAVEDAYTLMEALSLPAWSGADTGEEAEPEDDGYRRDFAFATTEGQDVRVHLVDKLAGTNAHDADDVGLQSWGASILFARLLCHDPARFGLDARDLPASPRPLLVELGAGTGLVSLTLAALLPRLAVAGTLVATDYHPAVLENLRANIAANAREHDAADVETRCLDWSRPDLSGSLAGRAAMLFATDVIYSPQHAVWLRDCAARMLQPGGVFWLVAAVRQNGKFAGVCATVREAFADREGVAGLRILESERMEKSKGIGRGDESWYELFKIGWA